MTENELKKTIAIYKKTLEVTADNGETCFRELDKNTLLFLEELEQYRAIGTAEEFKAFKLGRLGNKGFITIGQTIEEFKEEIRNKAIDEFCEKLCDAFCENSFQETVSGIKGVSILTLDGLVEIAWNLAEDMKGVRNDE